MLFKVIIFAIVAIAIYRFFGGKVPIIDRKREDKRAEDEHDFGKIQATSECATCGTYMTEDDAIIYHKRAYCSKECLERASKA